MSGYDDYLLAAEPGHGNGDVSDEASDAAFNADHEPCETCGETVCFRPKTCDCGWDAGARGEDGLADHEDADLCRISGVARVVARAKTEARILLDAPPPVTAPPAAPSSNGGAEVVVDVSTPAGDWRLRIIREPGGYYRAEVENAGKHCYVSSGSRTLERALDGACDYVALDFPATATVLRATALAEVMP